MVSTASSLSFPTDQVHVQSNETRRRTWIADNDATSGDTCLAATDSVHRGDMERDPLLGSPNRLRAHGRHLFTKSVRKSS